MFFHTNGRERALIALLLFSLLLAPTAACNAASPAVQSDANSGALTASPRDRNIARCFTQGLELTHISRQRIDEAISARGFELYLKAIDPSKFYLTKQDVDEFAAAYARTMATSAKSGDVAPAFVIYNRYLQRVDERCAAAQKLLDENNFDFTVDETFLRDKDRVEYPGSDQEVADRVRKRVKFELLSFEAEERDKKRENEEKGVENKESVEAVPGRAEDPVSKLKRRYSTLQKRLHQSNNDDVLELYLTAIANAYDPHTTYMSPKSYENFMITIGLNLEGIGATLQWDDGYTIVKRIVKGSPAEKQGELQVEDKIVAVGQGTDGPMEDVVDMKLTDVVDKIRGKGGTTVRLDVVSQDGKRKQIAIVREKVDLEDSAAQSAIFEVYRKKDGELVVVDPRSETDEKPNPDEVAETLKVGVIDLPSFYLDMKAKNSSEGRSVSSDVRAILDDFNAKNVDACVVDLRYNGGGSLPEAVKLTGFFIETGTVVQTKPSNFGDRPYPLTDPDPAIVWTKPLVVMTSRLSASASEIFAGAIRDYGRGLIVGDETTHGKGSVQSMSELANNLFGRLLAQNAANLGAMKVTIQGYYLPSGVSPQLQGVKSDVVLPQFTSALEDIAESDLDYPLTFKAIDPASYPKFGYAAAKIVDPVRSKSKERVAESKEFQDELEKIKLYKESSLRKEPTLNREKYFAELDKLNANKEETDKLEEMVNGDSGVKRDYYLDETLRITTDYFDQINLQNAL
ncbi:MAG: carboxy terminal-processing peptidase [Thermoguttaceae bacterium]|nr:carboxy terminal-processing peptidase [Thermoguttaceae bacterium]